MRRQGAVIVDPVDIETIGALSTDEFRVLLHEFPRDLQRFFEWWGPGAPVRTVADVIAGAARALAEVFEQMPGGVEAFVRSGPAVPAFSVLARDLHVLVDTCRQSQPLDAGVLQAVFGRVRQYFLTQDGKPRKRPR